MNLLARAKLSIQRSPINRSLFTTIQHCNSYATRTTTQKTQQLTNPKFQKPSTFPQKIKKQVESLTTVWSKPKEIPFQFKVANVVNLIGHVTTPVKFETGKDGKDFAFTVISQENDNGKNSLSIPVVFEGDLAHTVSCHVKEKDCVFVSGLLSAETMRVSLGESFGKFHVVAENLNFVEGFKRVAVNKTFSGVKMPVKESENVVEVENDVELNKKWKTALEEAIAKTNRELKIDSVSSVEMKTDFEKPRTQVVSGSGNNVGKGFERSTESVGKKKDGNAILDLWRDVVKNPLQWYDYRGHKANGLVKEKFPDFKQKGSGEGLWMSSAPSWILPGIQKLEFDVKEMTGAARVVQKEAGKGWGESARVVQKESGKGRGELWKSLVEDPSKWWDNRTAKRNPRTPDFKHKETGEAVWVDKLPDWTLAKLPPVHDNMQRS